MTSPDDLDNVMLDTGIAEADDMEARERLYNPSDLQDVGDPEGTDVGVPFGLAAGGMMGEGGRDFDGNGNDPWGSGLNDTADDEVTR